MRAPNYYAHPGFERAGLRPPPTGMLVQPGVDRVTLDGKPVEVGERHHYVVLNKPAGVITTARDPEGRPTVLDLLPPELEQVRLFPVGRLDADTTGLLLMTDDGELAHRLAHPGHAVAREYLAVVAGVPGEGDLRRLRQGVHLADGRTQPAAVGLVAARSGLTKVRVVVTEPTWRRDRPCHTDTGPQWPTRRKLSANSSTREAARKVTVYAGREPSSTSTPT